MNQKIWDRYIQRDKVRGLMIFKKTPLYEMRRFLVNYMEHADSKINGKSILDVGCGSGEVLDIIQKKYPKAKLTGVTLNKSTDQKNLKKLKLKAKIVEADMHEMPFEDESFDIVYCVHTLEHSISPYILLAEINRVLKTDGHIVICLPEEGDCWTCDPQHFHTMTPMQLASLLDKTGFDNIITWRSKAIMSRRELKRDLNAIWQKKKSWKEHTIGDKSIFFSFDVRDGFTFKASENQENQIIVLTKLTGDSWHEATTNI